MATGGYYPGPVTYLGTDSFNTGGLIDATGEKVAIIGRVWNSGGGTKSIRKVGIRFGAVTKAGGSALTLSLQDVDLTAGPVFRPDGTQDQTVAIANGSIVADTFVLSGALSADRSTAFGELVAIVIEFDGSGRLGSDSIVVANINILGLDITSGAAALFASAAWSGISCYPTVLFEFSDGSYGSLDGGVVVSDVGNISHSTGSTPDEVALKFTAPFDCTCDGGWIRTWKDANHDIVLYDGTSVLASVSVDANAVYGTYAQPHYFSWPAVTLTAAGGPYYLAHKPTTGSSSRVFYADVANAAYWAAMPGGTSFTYAARTDAGAWTETTTRRLAAGVRLSPTGGGGGGLLAHPGMRGGFA